jgi:hypothetical protein
MVDRRRLDLLQPFKLALLKLASQVGAISWPQIRPMRRSVHSVHSTRGAARGTHVRASLLRRPGVVASAHTGSRRLPRVSQQGACKARGALLCGLPAGGGAADGAGRVRERSACGPGCRQAGGLKADEGLRCSGALSMSYTLASERAADSKTVTGTEGKRCGVGGWRGPEVEAMDGPGCSAPCGVGASSQPRLLQHHAGRPPASPRAACG